MDYLVLHYSDPDGAPFDQETDDRMLAAWISDVDRRGAVPIGNRLEPEAQATSVRVRDDRLLVTDGPFAETKELLGFDVLHAADLDEAIEIMSRHPTLRWGRIEIRPFLVDPS